MTFIRSMVLAGASLGAGTSAFGADRLLIPDDAADRIMMFDATDGSVVDANWLTELGAVGWAFSTPKEAARVGDEYWVSDQVEDRVHRFDLNRNYLSSISMRFDGVLFDNLRGMGVDAARVYVACAGSPINSTVQIYSHTGAALGQFQPGGGVFDIEPFMGDLLVSNDTGTDAIQRWTTGGLFVGNFVSGGLNTPQQLVVLPDNSVILINSLGAVGTRGLIHYNSDATVREFIDVQSIGNPSTRGGMLLDNGNYLISTATGIYLAERTPLRGTFTLSLVLGGVGGQYITRVPGPCPFDLDGDGAVGSGDLALLLGSWGSMAVPADFDGGGVGSSDLALLLGAWGAC